LTRSKRQSPGPAIRPQGPGPGLLNTPPKYYAAGAQPHTVELQLVSSLNSAERLVESVGSAPARRVLVDTARKASQGRRRPDDVGAALMTQGEQNSSCRERGNGRDRDGRCRRQPA
jgi:hypothetical protein